MGGLLVGAAREAAAAAGAGEKKCGGGDGDGDGYIEGRHNYFIC